MPGLCLFNGKAESRALGSLKSSLFPPCSPWPVRTFPSSGMLSAGGRIQGKPLLLPDLTFPGAWCWGLIQNAPCLGTSWSQVSFSPAPGPGTVDSQGQIEFLRCFATLKTKSQTKFYLEFHSSCLESKWALSYLWPGSLFINGALPHLSLSLGRIHRWASRAPVVGGALRGSVTPESR